MIFKGTLNKIYVAVTQNNSNFNNLKIFFLVLKLFLILKCLPAGIQTKKLLGTIKNKQEISVVWTGLFWLKKFLLFLN